MVSGDFFFLRKCGFGQDLLTFSDFRLNFWLAPSERRKKSPHSVLFTLSVNTSVFHLPGWFRFRLRFISSVAFRFRSSVGTLFIFSVKFTSKMWWILASATAMAAISVHQFAKCITCHAWSPDHSSTLFLTLMCLFFFFFFFLSHFLVYLLNIYIFFLLL